MNSAADKDAQVTPEQDATSAPSASAPEVETSASDISGQRQDLASGNDQDEVEDDFFAKSFARSVDSSASTEQFAVGLRSLFETDDEEVESAESAPELELSESERIQRDLELERREALDEVILQNDADFLFQAGEKYEAPRMSEDDFATGVSAKPSRASKGSCASDADRSRCDFARPKALVRPESILEAMLFVGDKDNTPLSLKRACELMRNVSELEAIEALADLNERYYRDGSPYKIVRDGDGYRLVLRAEFNDVLARFSGKTKEFKLSQSAIDVLSIVAYRQPVAVEEILELRPNATNVLTQLVKRDLIIQERVVLEKKKTSVYRTTERFLQLFNLKSLDDLPTIGDVDYR
ncbi:MAG: SMC-Scp complex subunit ScpB [Planctomycetia bacterium]|nr:SMC-Scp complex subunit ScpB [Planctomycetia bacterium]